MQKLNSFFVFQNTFRKIKYIINSLLLLYIYIIYIYYIIIEKY